jgi:hypothetical protein
VDARAPLNLAVLQPAEQATLQVAVKWVAGLLTAWTGPTAVITPEDPLQLQKVFQAVGSFSAQKIPTQHCSEFSSYQKVETSEVK